jgi:hypothetical protein
MRQQGSRRSGEQPEGIVDASNRGPSPCRFAKSTRRFDFWTHRTCLKDNARNSLAVTIEMSHRSDVAYSLKTPTPSVCKSMASA